LRRRATSHIANHSQLTASCKGPSNEASAAWMRGRTGRATG